MTPLRTRLIAAITRWDRRNSNPYAGAHALCALDKALKAIAGGAPIAEALRKHFNDRLLAALERAAGPDLDPELPGTGWDAARRRGRLMRLAAAPLKPKTEQLPCDHGLFGDGDRQLDLVDVARRAALLTKQMRQNAP